MTVLFGSEQAKSLFDFQADCLRSQRILVEVMQKRISALERGLLAAKNEFISCDKLGAASACDTFLKMHVDELRAIP